MGHAGVLVVGEGIAAEAQAEGASHATAEIQRQIRRVVQRLGVVVGHEREQIRRWKDGAQPLQVVAHVHRRRSAVVHPGHVGKTEHADVEPVAAARHVLDQQARVALAQLRQHVVQRAGVREVAVGRAMVMPLAIAVDEHVVVPFQIVRLDLVDERRQVIHQPLARGGIRQANLSGVIGAVLPALGGEPRLLDPGFADQREVHALGFDPQAEPQPEAVRVGAERGEAVREARRIGGPVAEPRVEIERAGRAGARVPACIDHEQLDAERRRPFHLGAHRRLVDLRAVGEPGVVGDQRRDGTSIPNAVEHVRSQRRRACSGAAGSDAEHHVRAVDVALDRRGHGRQPDGDRHPGAAPIDDGRPCARPHQRGVKLVARAVDSKPGHVLLRGAVRRAQRERLAAHQRLLLERERAVGWHVGGVALQSGQPADEAVRHGDLQRVQIGDRRARAFVGGPGLERR